MEEVVEKGSGIPPIVKELMQMYRGIPAKYISNEKIEGFLKKRKFVLKSDIEQLQEYYRSMGLSRYSLQVWANKMDLGKYKILPSGYEKMKENLRLQNYSLKTIKAYLSGLKNLNLWLIHQYGKSIDEMNEIMARAYFLELSEKHRSMSLVKIQRFAIKYYFTNILQKEISLEFIEKLRSSDHLPTVLTRDEIEAVLGVIKNIKHRLIISLLYSGGLRVSEVVCLRKKDFNLEDLTLWIRNGKGRKDRITIFSRRLVDDLTEIFKMKDYNDYVFSSALDSSGQKMLSIRTVQKIFENAILKSNIGKKATCHDLRHSFATHLLENGTDLRYIQKLLGHKNVTSTTIYTRVSSPQIKGIKSPF